MGNGQNRQSGGSAAIADVWDGTTWTALRVPRPGSTSLTGVSCPSTGTCLAIGGITLGESWLPVAESWNGSAWAIHRTPKPRGATNAQLSSISCVSAIRCLAVGGNYESDRYTPFADSWNGTQWTMVSAPSIPAGAIATTLGSVSCSSRIACTATGSVYTSAGYAALAERWDGIYDTAHSRGAGPVFETLTELWNGTSWIIEPTKRLVYSEFGTVSCVHGTRCFAMGSQNDFRLPLAERWTGAKWVVESSVVTPPRHVDDVAINGISCTTDNICTTVGSYDGRTPKSGGVSPDYAGTLPLVEQRT